MKIEAAGSVPVVDGLFEGVVVRCVFEGFNLESKNRD